MTRKRWSGLDYNELTTPADPARESADQFMRRRYLHSLRSSAPVQWQSDHLGESQRLKGAVYLAIKCLGDQASQADLKAFRWHPEARQGGEQEAKTPVTPDHPIVQLLRHPNRHNTLGGLLRRMTQQVSLTGTALLWRVDDGFDTPRELWSIPTGIYQPIPLSPMYPEGGYRIQPFFPGPLSMIPGGWTAGGVAVDSRQMIACRHPHPLVEHEGLAPLAACDLALDTIEGIDRSRMSSVRRGVNPSGVCELDAAVQQPTEDDLTRAREELAQLMGGPDNSGRVSILPPGATLKPWGGNGSIEVGWIESWSQLIGFVLAIFGVTKSLAFLSDDTSFAALYASIRQHNLFTMCPLLSMLADAINLQLVWPFWGEEYFIELEPKKITDFEEQDKRVARATTFGGLTVNEGRVALGFEPTEEVWGSERAFAGKPAEPKDGKEEERKEPAEVSSARPTNEQGRGSLGDRLILNGVSRNGEGH